MDSIQLIIEIFTFLMLVVALFLNMNVVAKRHDAWHKFKVFAVAAALIGLIVWAKELAKFSVLFLIAALFSLDKNGKKNGHTKNPSLGN